MLLTSYIYGPVAAVDLGRRWASLRNAVFEGYVIYDVSDTLRFESE